MTKLNIDTTNTENREIIDFRNYGFSDIVAIGHYNYNSAQSILQEHKHEGMMEICLLKKGEQHYFVEDREYILKGGDVFITFPGESHSSGSFPESKGELYWLIVNIDPQSQHFLNFYRKEKDIFIEELTSISVRHFRATAKLFKQLESIFQLVRDTDNRLMNIALITQLSSFFIDLINTAAVKQQPPVSRHCLLLVDFIESHPKDEISIQQLASMANWSESHFKATFKKEIGIPPNDFILRTKINYACQLLSTGTASIADIAYELNFSSSQYFSTVFKRIKGTTPLKFCKQ